MVAGEIHIELSVNYADDPKIAALAKFGKDSRGARDLFVQMICYAKGSMTDGIVPSEILGRLAYPDTPKVAARQAAMLAEVGVIEPRENGWFICAYLRRNKSRAQIGELSAMRSEMGKRGGKQSGKSRRGEATTKQDAKRVASFSLNTESETESETESKLSTPVSSSPSVPRDPEHHIEDEPRSKPISVRSAIISREYCDRVKLSDRGKVAGVVTAAIDGGYEESAIKAALRRLAKDSRPVTPDTLRIEIDGKPGRPASVAAYTPPRNGMRGREGW